MDMTETIVPKSDQMNADDLMTGPRTFTITKVTGSGSAEQPVNVYLAEFPEGRPYKPSKSMRRVMVNAWGPESSAYVDKRLTLFRNPEITFGKDKVGGIQISHMSDIKGRLTFALTMSKTKRAPYTVEPLDAAAPASPVITPKTLAEMTALFERKGIPEEHRLAGVNQIIGGSATALEVITQEQATQVLASLNQQPDVENSQWDGVDK